jgi:hypothetical protein
VQPVLDGGGDPGLVRTVERDLTAELLLLAWSAWATLTSPAPMAAPARTPTPPAPMTFLRLGPAGCSIVISVS